MRQKLLSLQKEYLIELSDVMIAVKQDSGRVKLIQLINTTAVAVSAGFWDSCCAGGPEGDGTMAEYEKYGANRLGEGGLPLCAEMCSTKSLLAGDGEIIAQIYKERVIKRGYGSGAWGWMTAYREGITV